MSEMERICRQVDVVNRLVPVRKNARDRVVYIARAWVGRMFLPGLYGECATFVRVVYEQAGTTLPVAVPKFHTAWHVASLVGDEVGEHVEHRSQLQPADIVLLYVPEDYAPINVLKHVGIYVGDGLMVHRPNGEPVELCSLDSLNVVYQGRRPRLAEAPTKTRDAMT